MISYHLPPNDLMFKIVTTLSIETDKNNTRQQYTFAILSFQGIVKGDPFFHFVLSIS